MINATQPTPDGQSAKYRKLLLASGYHPDAKGLVDILKKMHDASLNRALAARAFREWQQGEKPASTREEAENE